MFWRCMCITASGEDADADAEYVRRICDEWGVGLRTFREDVRKLAGQSGLSLEEAGRDIRREIFLKVRGNWAAVRSP